MQTIYLDISNKGVIQTINAKQADVGRKFQAIITDGGKPYNLTSNVEFSVWYSGASGEGNYNKIGDASAFDIDGNKVTVELIAQMLNNPGEGKLCLIMTGDDGLELGTWNIPYAVEAIPGMGSLPAGQYFTVFNQLAIDAGVNAARAETERYLQNEADFSYSTIVNKATGNVIVLSDSSNRELQGLTLYGKTIQNGTPTPEKPVPLVSAGDSGSVVVKVQGKNLFNKDVVAVGYIDDANGELNPNPNYFASEWMQISGDYITITTPQTEGMWGAFYDANKKFIRGWSGYGQGMDYLAATEAIPANAKYVRITTKEEFLGVLQLELGSVATEYEPFKGQTLSIPTPNGLPGISGFNDELNLSNGTYTKRVGTVVLDGSEDWTGGESGNAPFGVGLPNLANCTRTDIQLRCDKYPAVQIDDTWSNYDFLVSRASASSEYICFRNTNISTIDAWKARLAKSPITVQYVLREPVVIPITAEQMVDLTTLHTYKPITTITNDGDAVMTVAYVADTKTYIDNKFNELAAALVNNT